MGDFLHHLHRRRQVRRHQTQPDPEFGAVLHTIPDAVQTVVILPVTDRPLNPVALTMLLSPPAIRLL